MINDEVGRAGSETICKSNTTVTFSKTFTKPLEEARLQKIFRLELHRKILFLDFE